MNASSLCAPAVIRGGKPLRIGVHPTNLHLLLATRWEGAFHDLDIEFVRYANGRESAALLAAGEIDLCGTSSTVPIFAASTGLDVTFLAASAQRRRDGALVVLSDSPIQSMQDLAGKTVGLARGSFQTYLLARALEKSGLNLNDVTMCDVLPAEGLAALQQARIDALVTLAPYQDYALTTGNMRLLHGSDALIPNRSVFWTTRAKKIGTYTLARFFEGLERLSREIPQNVAQAAYILAADDTSQGLRRAWQRAIVARDWSIHHINTTILHELQEEADVLFAHHVLDQQVNLLA
ncbi:ABC transporter substrate-binding protein [Acetobacter sp. TBRC 12305]|uniref:ABC transporter substrate-binding protein n=1 Tax=Acetobacter garciniae TaxID=2817435 RepID=A0A939HQG1_9PROT|nr:ABC transporter substrate-binding protein [Acetobacter garciniae]MBO1325576.1 ABC transporter substrate-binding protein [Acetobacter garciniae]MBX0345251.1 ABC transporter substrate-binding protein [Acetobacter garciniae]